MSVESLIISVNSYQALYDPSHHDYKNNKLKNHYWELVAAECGFDVPTAKQKWKHIRDRWVKENRIQNTYKKSGSGTSPQSNSEWPLFKYLEFLKPCLVHRPTVSNFMSPTSPVSTLSSSPSPTQSPLQFLTESHHFSHSISPQSPLNFMSEDEITLDEETHLYHPTPLPKPVPYLKLQSSNQIAIPTSSSSFQQPRKIIKLSPPLHLKALPCIPLKTSSQNIIRSQASLQSTPSRLLQPTPTPPIPPQSITSIRSLPQPTSSSATSQLPQNSISSPANQNHDKRSSKKKIENKPTDSEEKILSMLESNRQNKYTDDEVFLLGLAPSLGKVPEDVKHILCLEIHKLIVDFIPKKQ